MKLIAKSLAASALLVVSASALQAQITWGGAQTITDASDISTLGTSVDAISANRAGSTITIGDTTFKGMISDSTFSFNNAGGGGTDGSGSDATPYQAILYGTAYAGGGVTGTVTLSNLTLGQTYQLQIWNAAQNGRPTTFTGGNTVDLTGGDFALGTFLATSATESFTFVSDLPGGFGEVNAIALRDIPAVPEPSTYAAMVLGLLALAGFARFRKLTA